MCTIAAGIGMALALGGSALKMKQQNNAISAAQGAADRVMKRNMRDQRGMEGERLEKYQDSLKKQSRPEQEASAGQIEQQMANDYAREAEADYGAQREAPTGNAGGDGQKVVAAEARRALADALSRAKKQGANKAKLNAWGEQAQRLGIDMTGNANHIAVNQNLARIANATAAAKAQRVFNNKMAKVGGFGLGDALQAAGAVVSMGGGGLFSGGAGAPTALSAAGAMPAAPAGTMFDPKQLASFAGVPGTY